MRRPDEILLKSSLFPNLISNTELQDYFKKEFPKNNLPSDLTDALRIQEISNEQLLQVLLFCHSSDENYFIKK